MHAFWEADPRRISIQENDKLLNVLARPLTDCRIYTITDLEYPHLLGMLANAQWHPRSVAVAQKAKRPLRESDVRHILYPDLYWLLRGLNHADAHYTHEELPRLQEVITAVRLLNSTIMMLSVTNVQDLISSIELQVDQALRLLTERVRVITKVEARDQLVKVRLVYDSLHRVNPSALLARLVAALLRLLYREQDITTIEGKFALRQCIVRIIIATLDAQVTVSEDFLTKLLAHWADMLAPRRTMVIAQLRAFAGEYAKYRVQPFLATFTYASDEFARAADALEAKGPRDEEARVLLQTALASFQLRQLRTDMEYVVTRVSDAKHAKQAIDLVPVIADINALFDRLRAIDCTNMRGFSSAAVGAELLTANAFFGQTVDKRHALHQGYEALRHCATSI